MTVLTVMSVNVENLFARFNFGRAGPNAYRSVADAYGDPDRVVLAKAAYNSLQEDSRTATALEIAEADPDVICLQEIDSLRALDFLKRVGKRREYKYRYLIEGNDPRGIDVAVLSRYRIESATSYRDVRNEANTATLFSRDCLEVQVRASTNNYLWIYVNHLKSMMGGRGPTRTRRLEQAKGIRKIIEDRHADPAAAKWAIVGDLNDYYHVEGTPEADDDHALGPLDIGTWCKDMTRSLPAKDRWTHYWAGGNEYRQLDYILASPAVDAATNDSNPQIIRKGLPFRAERYPDERYPRIGYDQPKASDHCPVAVSLDV